MKFRNSFLYTILFAAVVLSIHWMVVPISGQLLVEDLSLFELSVLESEYAYFMLLGCTILFPLLLSFDQKVNYIGKWKFLIAPFIMVSIPYIFWDIFFTKWQVWGFNESYLSGIELFELPIEEVLFFFIIPFACIFIYECVRAYQLSMYLGNFSKWLLRIMGLVSMISLFLFYGRHYTFSASIVAVLMIIYIELQLSKADRNNIYSALFLSFLPFLLINGILTGIATDAPIVFYNMNENLGVRFLTIPLDDFIYQSGLLSAMLVAYQQSKWPSPKRNWQE